MTDDTKVRRMVEITMAPVELYKILKFENLAASGGEAKFRIQDGQVRVNGEIETRKRRKIRPGDVIETPEAVLTIVKSEP
ncbi:RNA-binding S4 domain-containing protein [Desulfotignum phosphitoxidans]|uniref:RNA-binding S4 domain-containing protein n=1 Tax=Desulfotignum phosphitoxidans DSM 13687 TaxID=1286635 RepID=S0G118_9BACT|nr:RNA-binding S4 domain-containing protein [Desulfotignum phosphitoxidans]EMS81058.1 RNA-binding S4 domain-containing protein [Desulfotignum phosphitoxidans DSM 13687]